jgi:DNA-binding transcriptional LysR family regulator
MAGRRDAQPLLDLPALRAFLAVSASGSMTLAARRLGLTQSAVSQAVRQLEEMLGTVLLDRSQRPLTPTPAGRLLQRHAAPIVDEAQALATIVRQAGSRKVPELRLGIVDSFAATVGPGLIRRLLDATTRLSFRSGLTHDQVQGLLSRQLDMIITGDAMDDVDGFDRALLMTEPFVLVTPPQWSAAEAGGDLKQLAARYPLIRFSARSQIGAQIERHLRRLGVRAPQVLEVDASDALVAMVAAGLGWAIATPLCLLQAHAGVTGVRVRAFPETRFTRQLYLIVHSGEFGDLPQEIATHACDILRKECLSELKRFVPREASPITIGEAGEA